MSKVAPHTTISSHTVVPQPTVTNRRNRTQHTIQELMTERTQLLSQFSSLSGTSQHQSDHAELEEHLKGFCQILMDYLALGHFEIYQRILEGKERRHNVRESAATVYPLIAQTTDILIEFNDLYASDTACKAFKQLASDIYRLGETLSLRFEMEDTLLEALSDERRNDIS